MNENKVAIYIRVSTNYQIDKDSLPMQRSDLISYCKLMLNTDKYVIYEDAGYSGKNTSRPRYQEMMSHIRQGEFTHLLVWKIDRISRNLLDFSEMYAELQRLNVTFVSKNEQFDTSTAMGEAMLKIILVFAELERKMTSERVSATMLSRANNGEWNGGRVPYGYEFDKETKIFSINEEEGSIVKTMFNQYLKCKSYAGVARYLNNKGLKSRNSNMWNSKSVSVILKSPFYVGDYRYNKSTDEGHGPDKDKSEWIVIKNHHPAIVSRATQNKCLAIIDKKTSSAAYSLSVKNTKHTAVFAGLIRCGKCGSFMYPKHSTRTPFPSFYCRQRYISVCRNGELSERFIGEFVLSVVFNIIKIKSSQIDYTDIIALKEMLLSGSELKNVESVSEQSLKDLSDMLTTENIEDMVIFGKQKATKVKEPITNKVSQLKKERSKYTRALDRLTNLYLYSDSNMSEKEYTIKKEDILRNIDDIDKELGENEKKVQPTMTNSDFLVRAGEFILANELQSADEISFKELYLLIPVQSLKNFFQTIISSITVEDSFVTSIQFANNLTLAFTKKNLTPIS